MARLAAHEVRGLPDRRCGSGYQQASGDPRYQQGYNARHQKRKKRSFLNNLFD
ncbi:MAG TPA: hypothetical protein VEX66_09685 [Microlunatus sp.]|nr:hypothetical protein [Microlunatus sp.]